MLLTLTISNFAIIDQITIDFEKGMSVLTGETGAGKSIIIDALGLLAGARSSVDWIRKGADKAVIQGVYDITNIPDVSDLLEKLDIPTIDNQVVLSRTINQSGKNIVRINETLSTVTTLKEIGALLIDIHNQHEHQLLMDERHHLQLLDEFGKVRIQPLKEAYQTSYQHFVRTRKRVKQLMIDEQTNVQQMEALKKNLELLEKIRPKKDEDVQLEQQLKEQLALQKTMDALFQLDYLLSNEEVSVKELLSKGVDLAYDSKESHDQYTTLYDDLFQSLELVNDVARRVGDSIESSAFDQELLSQTQERLVQLDELKHVFELPLNAIVAQWEEIKTQLDVLENRDRYLARAQQEFLQLRNETIEHGERLSQERQNVAQKLAEKVHVQLSDLYMDKAVFHVQFVESEKVKLKPNGIDTVAFVMSTNVGEPLKPIADIASGGELSRMMLALKVIFSSVSSYDTIVFDEIDTGVSGRVAQTFADKMYTISQGMQVLCITHLPQVAAIGDQQLYIEKQVEDTRTKTVARYLSMDERIDVVAEMITGSTPSQVAKEHAKNLIARDKV